MKSNQFFPVLAGFCFFLTACQSDIQGQSMAETPNIPIMTETVSPLSVSTSVQAQVGVPLNNLKEMTSMPSSMLPVEVFVKSSEATAKVQVGQTVLIVAPGFSPGWDVKYDETFLDALSPSDLSQLDDEKGWLFRATMVGTTGLFFVGQSPACEGHHPCLSMPTYEFSITLKILP